MIEVRQTAEFAKWIARLRDTRGRAKIAARIDRLSMGHPGDVRPVGEGISELRIHDGPGYRIYYAQRGTVLIVLLCGGDKSSQSRDIATAKKLAAEL
ncbi:MAG TPA: type II toxin-antitoxin system RelE/ParE family toxin [Reyranella sp.]|jgi:putative addiction module killer protein|nr:type II toxin-antitoxin system RelE/ParE family toxin [Reyranella sp.]